MTLPTIPINIITFVVMAIVFSGIGLWMTRSTMNLRTRSLQVLGFGTSGALALMSTITAVEYIPNDWSACRIAVPLSLLYGYHLYSNLNTDPSNAFYYLPIGAWLYIPAAIIGKIYNSATVCLTCGWLTTVCAYLTPLIVLLYRLKNICVVNILLIFTILIYSLSLPQLKYVFTMIHVDAAGIMLAGTSLVLILPLKNQNNVRFLNLNLFASGILLGLAIFVKQTLWPTIVLISIAGIYIHRKKALIVLCGVILSSIVSIAVICVEESPYLIKLYCFQASTSIPQGMKLIDSLKTYISISWAAYAALIFLFVLIMVQVRNNNSIYLVLLLSVISLIITPFSIYTFSRSGADVNHFAWPLYLILCSIIILLSSLAAEGEKEFICGLLPVILLGSFMAVPYLKTNCGWYLLNNNPHQCALDYAIKNPGKIYFPWQPLTSLFAEKKMYHIDQGLMFEEMLKIQNRSAANINAYLPPPPFKIALRPFSAPSYVVQKEGYVEAPSVPDLPGWKIYQKN